MKKVIRVIFTVFLLQSVIFIDSCQQEYVYYTARSLAVENFNASGMVSFYENTEILYSDYCINIRIPSEIISRKSEAGFAFNTLFAAVDPPEPVSEVTNKVTKVEIICIHDFDSTHSSGSTVNDCFIPYLFHVSWIGNKKLTDFPAFDGMCVTWEDVFNKKYIPVNSVGDEDYKYFCLLSLQKKPIKHQLYQFIIKLHLNDNTIMADTTGPVQFKD